MASHCSGDFHPVAMHQSTSESHEQQNSRAVAMRRRMGALYSPAQGVLHGPARTLFADVERCSGCGAQAFGARRVSCACYCARIAVQLLLILSTSRTSTVHGLLKATRRAETRADVYANRLTRHAQIPPIYPLLPPLASGLGLCNTLQPEAIRPTAANHTPEQRSEAERQSEQEASGRRPGYRSAGAQAPRTAEGGEAQRGLW